MPHPVRIVWALSLIPPILLFPTIIICGSYKTLTTTVVNVAFNNLSNISVGNFDGVTSISFSTWRACYYANSKHGPCTKVTHLPNLPYILTVNNGDNGHSVTTSPAWSTAMPVLQISGFVIALLLPFILWYYINWLVNGQGRDKRLSEWLDGDRYRISHFRVAITLWIVFSAWLSIGILAAADFIIYMQIQSDMLQLGPGGISTVVTTPGAGFALNVAAFAFLSIALLVKLWDKGYRTKNLNRHANKGAEPSRICCGKLCIQWLEC